MNTNLSNTNSTLRFISVITIFYLMSSFLERAVQEGMFFDGITYATIGRNLAMGKGSFWQLYYRNEWTFSEHPPLMFGILSVFFRLLGDHFYTEKIYSLFIWIISIGLIIKLWNNITEKRTESGYALPLLTWALIPTVLWSYPNCLVDCTMAVFDFAAVYLLYNTCKRNTNFLISFTISAIFIFCAFLTKGPVGLFPLAVPFLYWIIIARNNFIKMALLTLMMIAIITAIFVVLWQFDAPRHSFERYFNEQLFAALKGKRETTGGNLGRFAIITEIVSQLLPPIGFGIVVIVLAKVSKTKKMFAGNSKNALFFLAIALSASLPIMLSVKQRSFYLIPSFPFYAIAIALFLHPYFMSLVNRYRISAPAINILKYSSFAIGVVICIYLYTQYGKLSKDAEYINDLKAIQRIVPKGEKVGICREMDKDYTFLAYAMRYNYMEVNLNYKEAEYILADNALCSGLFIDTITSLGYKNIPSSTKKYKIYKKLH